MFVVMSFSFGLAFYLLMLMFLFQADGRELGDVIVNRLRRLLGVFVAGVFYFTLAYHLTNLYGTENHEVEAFILLNGGIYTSVFWVGEILLGTLLPLAIIFHPALGASRGWLASACGLVLLGGLSKVYVILVGGQAFPMALFPGKTVVESGFFDGVNGAAAAYIPSAPEIILGVGGIAFAVAATLVATRVLKFLPESLADERVDPHAASKA
jgi:molybdopterin-containing oxidoreductase family membrane subunit